jgi:hypothetical protein
MNQIPLTILEGEIITLLSKVTNLDTTPKVVVGIQYVKSSYKLCIGDLSFEPFERW